MHRSNSIALQRPIVALLTLFLIGTLLIGCHSTRTLPDWQGEVLEETATTPIEKCTWPDVFNTTVEGMAGGFFDTPELKQLKACRTIAETNHDIAAQNAEAIKRLLAVHNKTEKQGQRYIDLAEFQLNELERDRREANIEAWTYKGLLALVLIGTALP